MTPLKEPKCGSVQLAGHYGVFIGINGRVLPLTFTKTLSEQTCTDSSVQKPFIALTDVPVGGINSI